MKILKHETHDYDSDQKKLFTQLDPARMEKLHAWAGPSGVMTCFGPGMHAPKARAVQLSHVASMRAEDCHLFAQIHLQSSLTSLDYLGPQDRRRRSPHGYWCVCDAPLRVPGPL